MRVMKLEDVGAVPQEAPHERGDAEGSEVAVEKSGKGGDPRRRRPGLELAPAAARERDRMAELGHSPASEQDLVLAAAPRAGGVHVQDPQRADRARISSWSFASLV